MTGTSPKYKTKSPINIDALIICKKIKTLEKLEEDAENIQQLVNDRYKTYLKRFRQIGRKLTDGDKKVVYLSQLLNIYSKLGLENWAKISKAFTDEGVESIINSVKFDNNPDVKNYTKHDQALI